MHALRLAAHPVFNQRVPTTITQKTSFEDLELLVNVGDDDTVTVAGQVSSEVPIHAMVAYFDPQGGGDYDATTATAVPDSDGRFKLSSGQLIANKPYELRWVACHVNGSTSVRQLPFRVDESGHPDLAAVRLELELAPMIEALRNGDISLANQKLTQISASDEKLNQIGRRVLQRFDETSSPQVQLSSISSESKSAWLSAVKPSVAKVGWRTPMFDSVPAPENLLSIDGDIFARGIYAHSPAEYHYELDGTWKRLTGRCGVQTGHPGRVDFEIYADQRLVWTAAGTSAGSGERYDIDIDKVRDLKLVVSDHGDGTAGDWGVWIEPQLSR